MTLRLIKEISVSDFVTMNLSLVLTFTGNMQAWSKIMPHPTTAPSEILRQPLYGTMEY